MQQLEIIPNIFRKSNLSFTSIVLIISWTLNWWHPASIMSTLLTTMSPLYSQLWMNTSRRLRHIQDLDRQTHHDTHAYDRDHEGQLGWPKENTAQGQTGEWKRICLIDRHQAIYQELVLVYLPPSCCCWQPQICSAKLVSPEAWPYHAVNHENHPLRVKLIDFGVLFTASENTHGVTLEPLHYRLLQSVKLIFWQGYRCVIQLQLI